MQKFSIFTIIVILALLFGVPTLMASLIKMVPAKDQPGYGQMGRVSVYGDRTFTQYFVSTDKNLTSVATTIKNPNLNNKKDIYFNLYTMDNVLVRSVVMNGFNIGDGDFVKIIFQPIPDSIDKKYYFTLSSPSAGEEEIIELFITAQTSEILEYTYDEETKEGGAPIVTFHTPDSRLETVKSVYSNLFSKLF
ncbi:hypothetical protein KBD45_03360 [Candidatus Dojkabacteria bacterium]|nr:hypothetical protein [Candidatus Dojkabacteria bacterium]